MYTYEKVTNRAGGSSYAVIQIDTSDGSKVIVALCNVSGDADLIVTALNA